MGKGAKWPPARYIPRWGPGLVINSIPIGCSYCNRCKRALTNQPPVFGVGVVPGVAPGVPCGAVVGVGALGDGVKNVCAW